MTTELRRVVEYRNDTTGMTLTYTSSLTLLRIEGIDAPPTDNLTTRAPHQDGATSLGILLKPREVTLTILAEGWPAIYNFELAMRFLAALFNPKDPGTLTVTPAYTTVGHTLQCRVVSIERKRLSPIAAEVMVTLVADDPWFYGGYITATVNSTTTTGLTIPFAIPTTLNSPTNSAGAPVRNDGHYDTPATFTVRVPPFASAKNLTVRNELSGLSLRIEGTFSGPETIIVDMGRRQVKTESGRNLMAQVAGRFWPLVRGTQRVTVASDLLDRFSVEIRYRERFVAVN